jgi:hypothetical protein
LSKGPIEENCIFSGNLASDDAGMSRSKDLICCCWWWWFGFADFITSILSWEIDKEDWPPVLAINKTECPKPRPMIDSLIG